MSHNIFFIADTHFNHANILNFTDEENNKIRPNFLDVNHMNEVLIENWNSVVKPNDKVYHLGDVLFSPSKGVDFLSKLQGRKRLVLGNHDDAKLLAPYFEKIFMWRIFKEYDFMCTHLPIRNDQMREVQYNVHGHLHAKSSPTYFHINVSCERINYTPIHLDEIIARIKTKKSLYYEGTLF